MSTAFALGPAVSIPIRRGFAGTPALRESRERRQPSFRNRPAPEEVDDAITAYRATCRGHVARSVSENQAVLQAAGRYSEGAIDFLNVITAQAQLLQSENDLADSDTQIATYLVTLSRARGWEVAMSLGGWHAARD